MFRLAAEPKRWMRVTAPVAAALRLMPTCLIRCVAITGWMIGNTGASSSGWTAKRLRSGIGNDSTHCRTGTLGMTRSTMVLHQAIQDRCDECAAHHARLEENWAKKLAAGKDASPIAPAWISHCINKVRTRDAIIVKESPLQTQYLDVDRPCMVLNPGAASGLGHGMGVALGLKLAKRDTLVIGTEGDG